MAALLICGIDPPPQCNEIPQRGVGLDGKPLHGSDPRFHDARRILRKWDDWIEGQVEDEYIDTIPQAINPFEFFEWCLSEARISTEWLSLLLELIGYKDDSKADLTPARFALLTTR